MRCKVDAGIRCLIRFRAPIPEAIFLVNFSMWLCQLSLSSIITPSDFVAVTWLTWVLVILIVGEAVRVFSLCLDPISMNSVLVMFNVSLFACSQLKTFARSSFRQNWTFSRLLPAYVRCVSSAYILGLQFDKQFGRSLIYNKNNNGPRMVPWGTPHVNVQLLDSDPFTEHFCVRFSKYDWNHLKDLPCIP